MNKQAPVPLNYARPRRPKPRDWGVLGPLVFALVCVLVFCLAVILTPFL